MKFFYIVNYKVISLALYLLATCLPLGLPWPHSSSFWSINEALLQTQKAMQQQIYSQLLTKVHLVRSQSVHLKAPFKKSYSNILSIFW